MKSILIVIYAHYVKLIIEGKKTIELRKNENLANAIKKLIAEQGGCWIYIYAAKGHEKLYLPFEFDCFEQDEASKPYISKEPILDVDYLCNGKVVARFWCDKVEDTFFHQEESFSNKIEQTLKNSCLTYDELWNYVKNETFYKIHISKLEVFDKPRELCEFKYYKKFSEIDYMLPIPKKETCERLVALTKAPQNYCYIESEE